MTHRLEIGDKIAVLDSNQAAGFRKITRVTETMAFAKVLRGANTYELRFARDIPNTEWVFAEKGNTSWNKTFYRLAKEGDGAVIREKTLRLRVSRIDWTQVSIEKIEQILNLLQK